MIALHIAGQQVYVYIENITNSLWEEVSVNSCLDSELNTKMRYGSSNSGIY